jgi:hypothetical protein
MTEPKDRSAIVLPFGKHKGSTVAELLARDPAYAEWIVAQGWVAERFAELHAAILSRGTTSDDSPEHNAIQVRFLDETFRLACLLAASSKGVQKVLEDAREAGAWSVRREQRTVHDNIDSYLSIITRGPHSWELPVINSRGGVSVWEKEHRDAIAKLEAELAGINQKISAIRAAPVEIWTRVRFEQRGVDVLLAWGGRRREGPVGADYKLPIEIKPTMGDDFPTVMRQMERLDCEVLVLGEYTGRAVSAPQLRQMFEANGKRLLFVRDIEAEIPNARVGSE